MNNHIQYQNHSIIITKNCYIINGKMDWEDFVSLCEKRGLKPSHIERLINKGKKY